MPVPLGIPICPITQEPMKEPVIDHEGNSYEKKAILEWLKSSNESPITRNIIRADQLIINRALIDSFNNLSIQRNQEKTITNCSKCNKTMALSNKYKGTKHPTCYNCRDWSCKHCTFINKPSNNNCEMCEQKR